MLEMFSGWLAPVRAQLPPDLPAADAAAFSHAVTQEALRRFGDFLTGIQSYQTAPVVRAVSADGPVIWQKGTTRLLDYAPDSHGPVLLVVPSLINRFEILDLDTNSSFLRFLATQGLHPLVLDWDKPGDEEKFFSLSDYVVQRLEPAFALACTLAPDRKASVLGYCMGGVLALALAVRQQELVASLTLMATPWDFAVQAVGGVPPAQTPAGQFFLQQARNWLPCLGEIGTLPTEFLQAMFTGFQPLHVLQKFSRFADAAPQENETRRFVLTEDWLNNGVPLSLPVAQECLEGWYADNVLARLAWVVDGTLIDPRRIYVPTCCILPRYDKVVPSESARPLAALISGAVVQEPSTGHLGLMASDDAPAQVWAPYTAWLKSVL